MSAGKGDAQKNMESMEYLARGPKGEQGGQGERGARGLPRRVAWAIVVLFLIGAGVETANLIWTAYEVRSASSAQQSEQTAQRRQAAAERTAQQRAAAVVEQKLCATLEPLAGVAGLRPPAGNPDSNPSRAFEQQLVVKLAPLAQLGPDLDCGKAARP